MLGETVIVLSPVVLLAHIYDRNLAEIFLSEFDMLPNSKVL